MRSWNPQPSTDLPDGTILFDGVCVLCAFWVSFIIPRDRDARFRFVAIQSDLGRQLAERMGIDPDYPETNVVIRDGAAWFKADAALQVLTALPGWRWTGVARLMPRLLRNLVYDAVARNRYRLFGKRDACLVPTPAIRARFVTTLDPAA